MRLTREKLVAGAAVALLALTGCGGSSGSDDGAAKAVPATATGSLEDLAAEVKCKPDIQTDADEIRQAVCKSTSRKFILATFATDRGQREWLNEAKDYGGFYLVGAKWVAVGTRRWSRRCADSSAGPWRRELRTPRTARAPAVTRAMRARTRVTAAEGFGGQRFGGQRRPAVGDPTAGLLIGRRYSVTCTSCRC
ncbi:hypothetical protein SAV31267_030630 [Streptomyces avermitilis]|uniref:Lipoprotein n=1 Tax=Streptomyces avermitilis TaxID=33903 RepID=A0A4D4MNB6_STRAX|nr:hypothetical protein SAV31267_030630 [Streptomyces avermitilis]